MAVKEFEVYIENGREVVAALKAGKPLIRTAIRTAMIEGGREINKAIRQNCPEETGLLKSCIGEFDESYFKGSAGRAGMKSGKGFISLNKPRKSWATFKYDPSTFTLTIGTSVPYADWIENGVTVPGPICAKKRKYLRFVIDGEVYYRKCVAGHTIKPTFFFQRGVMDGLPKLNRILNKEVDMALKRLATGKGFQVLRPFMHS